MFGFNNMLGVIVDKNYVENLSKEEKEVLDIYFKICEAIIEKNIVILEKEIPNIQIKNILNNNKSKEEWIAEIEDEKIKYYGIELLETKIEIKEDKAIINSNNKIRAKLYKYRGSWIKESYMKLKKDKDCWKITEFFI